jgi:hypothetical protein
MKDTNRRVGLGRILAAAGALGLLGGCDFPAWTRTADARPSGPDWANISLNLMVDKYGPPDRIEIGRVVWLHKGPWKRIAVWDDMDLDEVSTFKDRNLEQTIAYVVPAGRRRDLEDFDARIKVSEDGAELSSRSYSEERNFLALNLADEVIRGAKTPEQAREFHAATLTLADAGKSSPYMKGLIFQAPPLPAAAALPEATP